MDNQNLEKRIEELEKWQRERKAQQVTYPLDFQSVQILNKYFLSKIADFSFLGASGLEFPNIIVRQDGKSYVISTVFPDIFTYTANATANTLTIGFDITTNQQGSFNDGDQVFVYSTDTPPNPLSSAIPYYVVNGTAGGTVIQLSTTFGGAAVNLTDVGTGQQFIQFFT